MSFNTRVKMLVFCFVLIFSHLVVLPAYGQEAEGSSVAQKLVLDRYASILSENVLGGKAMSADEVKAFEEEIIKSRDVKRYRAEFPEEVKLKLSMAAALVDFYAGNEAAAVKSAYRVVNASPDNKEMKNCCIYLAYMAKEYSYLTKLSGKGAGKGAVEAYTTGNDVLLSKVREQMAAAAKKAGVVVPGVDDPNIPVSDDPNSPNYRPRKKLAAVEPTPEPEPLMEMGMNNGLGGGRDGRGGGRGRGLGLGLGGIAAPEVVAPELKIEPGMMPIAMLGRSLDKMTLESINGSFVVYDPAADKTLCLLLSGYQDAGVESQVKALSEKFKSTGGSFGSVQYIGLVCNDVTDMSAAKFVFEDAVKYPVYWSQCVMVPGNKSQLTEIEPASSVVLIAGKGGEVRYVGPADCFLVDAIIRQEAGESAMSFQGELNNQSVPNLDMSAVNQMAAQAMAAAVQEAMQAALQSGAGGQGTVEIPAEDDIAVDPTVLQAKGKLDAARAKMKVPAGISFRSALELCDEVLAGWPNTRVAEEAKEIIADICSRSAGRQYKEQRIKEGKYVGEN